MKLSSKINCSLVLPVLICWGVIAAEASQQPFTIKGKQMQIKNKGAIIIYTDGVKAATGKNTVNMIEAVANEKTGEIMAQGQIEGEYNTEKGDIVKFTAVSAMYNKNEKIGYLKGGFKAHIKPAKSEDGEYYLEADEAVIFEAEGLIEAYKNIYISGDEADIWADKARYDSKSKTLVLSGRMPITASIDKQGINIHQSRSVSLNTQNQEVVFEGKVNSYIWRNENAGSDRAE